MLTALMRIGLRYESRCRAIDFVKKPKPKTRVNNATVIVDFASQTKRRNNQNTDGDTIRQYGRRVLSQNKESQIE